MAKFRKQRNREFKVYAEGSTACVIRHTSFQKGEPAGGSGVYVRVYDEDTGEHRADQVASKLVRPVVEDRRSAAVQRRHESVRDLAQVRGAERPLAHRGHARAQAARAREASGRAHRETSVDRRRARANHRQDPRVEAGRRKEEGHSDCTRSASSARRSTARWPPSGWRRRR